MKWCRARYWVDKFHARVAQLEAAMNPHDIPPYPDGPVPNLAERRRLEDNER